jgi:hypothetical protein
MLDRLGLPASRGPLDGWMEARSAVRSEGERTVDGSDQLATRAAQRERRSGA